MAVGEIQISALPQAALPIDLSDIFHLKQGIEDKRCTLEQLLAPHSSLRNNPHGVTKTQIGLDNVINALQLVAANNLSDVTNVAQARANLQIMSSEEVNNLVQQHIQDKSNPHNTTKAQVGLSNVQNWTTSNLYNEDADKYATARAVNNLYKAVQASYPVGTIHLSMNSANPSTYLICGGTWELVSRVEHWLVMTLTQDQQVLYLVLQLSLCQLITCLNTLTLCLLVVVVILIMQLCQFQLLTMELRLPTLLTMELRPLTQLVTITMLVVGQQVLLVLITTD